MKCILVVLCIFLINLCFIPVFITEKVVNVSIKIPKPQNNCTPPSIDDFPLDLFTQNERRQGYVLIHFIASIYMFYCLALVSQDYLVPCIECCCYELDISQYSAAGATLMAIASSSPQFYVSLISTFITQGDIGVGTILGSGVFNILGIAASVGLFTKNAVALEWYPLARDCVFYTISASLLIFFLDKQSILWYEAVILVFIYFSYLFVICVNTIVREWVENKVVGLCGVVDSYSADETIAINLSGNVADTVLAEQTPLLEPNFEREQRQDDNTELLQREVYNEDHRTSIGLAYEMTILQGIYQAITLPPRILFSLTIPNCNKQKFRKWYFFAFLLCKIWIAILSFLVSWTVTVIGHTLSIPDSVMGLTFLAAGASIPDLVFSIIVARSGLASMAMGEAIGSNIFDILICLGVPWFIHGCLIANEPVNYIKINSGGLKYSGVTLLLSLFILFMTLAWNKFYLDKKVGFVALFLYFVFLLIACLFEMNVFLVVNLPICHTDS